MIKAIKHHHNTRIIFTFVNLWCLRSPIHASIRSYCLRSTARHHILVPLPCLPYSVALEGSSIRSPCDNNAQPTIFQEESSHQLSFLRLLHHPSFLTLICPLLILTIYLCFTKLLSPSPICIKGLYQIKDFLTNHPPRNFGCKNVAIKVLKKGALFWSKMVLKKCKM